MYEELAVEERHVSLRNSLEDLSKTMDKLESLVFQGPLPPRSEEKVEANDVVSAFIGTVNYLNTRLSSILGTLQKIV